MARDTGGVEGCDIIVITTRVRLWKCSCAICWLQGIGFTVYDRELYKKIIKQVNNVAALKKFKAKCVS